VNTSASILGALHVEHARQATAVLSREPPGEDIDLANRGVDEGPEQTAEVERVVDGNAVEQDQVLVGFASPDVESGGEIVACRDARKEGRGAHDVAIANHGQLGELRRRDRRDARRRHVLEAVSLRAAGDRGDGTEGDRRRPKSQRQ
jgi:hypothetical protein